MALINPSEECLTGALKEFGTNKKQLLEDVQILKSWLHQQPHLPHLEDEVCLENMLVRCKCSIERAKQALEMQFTLKAALPEFFANRDPMSPDLQFAMDTIKIVPLPQVNSDGYRVVMLKNLDRDPVNLPVEICIKFNFMLSDIRLQEDTSIGDIYLYDFTNMTLAHFTQSKMPEIKKMEICASQGYRARVKAVHFINALPAMDIVLTLIKSFVRSKIISRFHVHSTLESLYEHVDRHVLPVEYGGDAKPLDQLGCEWKQKTEDYRDWFLEQEVLGKADETKRPGKIINTSDIFGFEGTFKRLAVD